MTPRRFSRDGAGINNLLRLPFSFLSPFSLSSRSIFTARFAGPPSPSRENATRKGGKEINTKEQRVFTRFFSPVFPTRSFENNPSSSGAASLRTRVTFESATSRYKLLTRQNFAQLRHPRVFFSFSRLWREERRNFFLRSFTPVELFFFFFYLLDARAL